MAQCGVTDGDAPAPTALTSIWAPAHPVDMRRTLRPLRRGSLDPTLRIDAAGIWRTSLTPDGPVTLQLGEPAVR